MLEMLKCIVSRKPGPARDKPARAIPDTVKPDDRVKLGGTGCKEPDPLKSATARRWVDGPLKPPSTK
jgi:hypothetical protein